MAVHNVKEFELWRPGYSGSSVKVYVAGTTTLANLYTDESLTTPADNPQTLLSTSVNDIGYGKFLTPLYTGQAYTLDVDSSDQTGITRPPITSLSGQDASDATVTPTGGSVATSLADILARTVYAEDYGELGATAATNTTTLTAAIGVVSGRGGGVVMLPEGTYEFNQLNIPANVVLSGVGRTVTVLQSQTAAEVLTFSGDRCGLANLTLDGVSLVGSSVGIYSIANDEIFFQNCEVKRFETGIHFKGGRRLNSRDLYIDNCVIGVKAHGDTSDSGDEFRNNEWAGGKISQCSSIGLDLSYEDAKVYHNVFKDIGFSNNTGTALNVNGARFTIIKSCWWSGNTGDVAVGDDDDTDSSFENTVISLTFDGGDFDGGTITFTDTCQDVVFDMAEFADVDFTLTLPENAILLQSSIEDSSVTISGNGDKLIRFRRIDHGASSGITTGAVATKAWSIALSPGQVGILEAKVLANRRDGTTTAAYQKVAKVSRPGSTLAYDNQTANFTVGDILTGGTSGATARISADADGGTTGTLTLRDIVGVFLNNETITDVGGGSADVNGTISDQNCVIDQADTIGTDFEDVAGWNAAFVANIGEVELQVTGAASTTIEWVVHVDVTLT